MPEIAGGCALDFLLWVVCTIATFPLDTALCCVENVGRRNQRGVCSDEIALPTLLAGILLPLGDSV